jgi:hypothetical protein
LQNRPEEAAAAVEQHQQKLQQKMKLDLRLEPLMHLQQNNYYQIFEIINLAMVQTKGNNFFNNTPPESKTMKAEKI